MNNTLVFTGILLSLFISLCNCSSNVSNSDITSDLAVDSLPDATNIDDAGADSIKDVGIEYKYVYEDKPFVQYMSRLYDTEKVVYSVISYEDHILFSTDDGVYRIKEGSFEKIGIFGDNKINRMILWGKDIVATTDTKILIGNLSKIAFENEFSKNILYLSSDNERVFIGFEKNEYALFENGNISEKEFNFEFEVRNMCASQNYYFFQSEDGIYQADKDLIEIKKINEGAFNSISCDTDDKVVAGSDNGFVIYDGNKSIRVSKEEKIPYPKIRSAFFSDIGVFALSDKGLMLYKEDGLWDYFHSRYYIPDWDVYDVFLDSNQNIIVATAKGVGVITPQIMTLKEKEQILYDGMKKRHNRMGFYSPSGFKKSGDFSTAYTFDNDNDGQWSGMYLATMCFKYAVTKDESVLNDARETLNALLLLETVTEKKGFFARSVVEPELCDIKKQGGGEWHLTSDGKWCFKGDTSSDEYVGHVFGLSIYYDLCANEEEKERIRQIHGELQRYIVLNGYKIVDLDGEVTTHGQFYPEWIKSTGLLGDAGLNSAMILGGIRFAYHITGDKFFEEHFYKLAHDERYFDYVRRIEDINTAVQINHDSEEMSFLALFTLIRLEKDAQYLKFWYEGLENIYQTQIKERDPEFNMIYAFFNPQKDYHLDDSIGTLKEFYTHGIEWKVYNSHRSDYTLDPKKDRFGRLQSLEVFPYNQKRAIRWAENPFVLDEDGEGYSEQIMTPWLLPYWMGRYIGVIK